MTPCRQGQAQMTGDEIKIVKGYKVFNLALTAEPMTEPSEFKLRGWLLTRGYSGLEVADIIRQVDEKGEITITLP